MKKIFWLGMFVLFMCMPADAQKIQYSRQTVKMHYSDDVQLVPNIKGNHHLLRLSINKKPVIYVFNSQLQLHTEATIDVKLQENFETRVVPFSSHYFFYTHTQKAATHLLYKVDGGGVVTSLSKAFQQIADSMLNKSSATLQLVNQNEKLFAIAHLYYHEIKKVESTVVELTSDIKVANVWKTTFDFDMEKNQLQQTVLSGNNLLVLTSGSVEEHGHLLNLMKIDLTTGRLLLKAFKSERNPYSNTGFRILPADSSILLHATLIAGRAGGQQSGFITHLSKSLEEITPLVILQLPFNNSSQARYFLLNDQSYWLNFSGNYLRVSRTQDFFMFRNRTRTSNQTLYNMPGYNQSVSSLPYDALVTPYSTLLSSANMERLQPTAHRRRFTSSLNTTQKNVQTMVRFTVLNSQLKTMLDTTTTVNKNEFGIQPWPYAQFSINNKASLFLIQNFTENKRGLIMVDAEKNGPIITTNINVNYKYEYLLHQMKANNYHSVLLPYTHKNEAGLVRISFE